MIKVKAFGILAALAALPVFAEPSAGQRTGEGNETTTAEYGLRYSTLARAGALVVRPTSEATGLSFTLGAETFDKAIKLGTEWRPIVFVPSAVTVTEIAVAIPGTEAPASLTVTPDGGAPVTFTLTGNAESVTLTGADGTTAAATLRTYESKGTVTLAPGQACGFAFDDTEVGTTPRNFYTFDGVPHLRVEGSATVTRHVLNISDGATHLFATLAGFDKSMDRADQVFVVEFSGAGGTLEMDASLQNAPLVIGSSVSSTKAAVSFDSAFTVPLSLRDGEGGKGGLSLTFGTNASFNPSALLLACDVTLKSPVNLPEGAWLDAHAVPIPAGRTFRLELDQPVGSENNLPNLSFADATSRLELASDAASPEDNPLGIPSKYQTMLCTQSGTLVLDRNVSVENANEEGSSVLSGFVLSDSRVAYGIPVNRPLETHVILRAGHTYDFGFMFGFEDYGPEMGSAPIGKATLTVEGGTVAVNTINLTATDATLDIQGGTVTAESLDGIDDGTNTAITVAEGATLRLDGGLPAGAADTTATLDLTVAGTLRLTDDLAMTPALRRTLTLAGGTIESTRYYPDVVYVTCGDGGTADGEGLLDIVGGGKFTGSLVVDAAAGQGDLALGADATLKTLHDFTGTVSGAGRLEAIEGTLGDVTLGDTWLANATGKKLGDVLTGWTENGTRYPGAADFAGTIGFIAGTETAVKTLDFTDLDELTSLGMAFRVANHQHIIMRLDQYADATIRWPDDPQGITLTLIESGAYGGELTLPHFPHTEGEDSGVKFEFATFNPEGGYTVRKDGYSHTHTEDGVNDTLTWDNPVFTGEGAWIDIEFNGNTHNTGWFTLRDQNNENDLNGLLRGDGKDTSSLPENGDPRDNIMDNPANFTAVAHPADAQGGLALQYRPYVSFGSLDYPEEWSVAVRLTAPNQDNICLLALGNNTLVNANTKKTVNSIVFATGDSADEIVCYRFTGTSATADGAIETLFRVTLPDIQDTAHIFSVVCEGRELRLYMDGAWLKSATLPDGWNLGCGLQVGAQLGARSPDGTPEQGVPHGFWDLALPADKDTSGGVIDYLRFYKGVLTDVAMVEMADRTPAVRENLRYVRYVPITTAPDGFTKTVPTGGETWIQPGAWLAETWDAEKQQWNPGDYADQPAEGAYIRLLVAEGDHALQVNVERRVDEQAKDYFYSPNRNYAALVVEPQEDNDAAGALRLVPYGVDPEAIEKTDDALTQAVDEAVPGSKWFTTTADLSDANNTGFQYGKLRFTGGAYDPITEGDPIAADFYGSAYLLGGTKVTDTADEIDWNGTIERDFDWIGNSGTCTQTGTRTRTYTYSADSSKAVSLIFDGGVSYFSKYADMVVNAATSGTRTATETLQRSGTWTWSWGSYSYDYDWTDETSLSTSTPIGNLNVGDQVNTLQAVAGMALTRGVMDEVARWQLTGPVVVQGTAEPGRDYVLGHPELKTQDPNNDQASEDVWVPFFTANSTWKFYDDTRVEGGAENADGALGAGEVGEDATRGGLFARGVQTPGRLYLDFTVGVGTGDAPGTAEDTAKDNIGNFSEQAWYRYGYEGNQTTATLSGMKPERASANDFAQAVAFQIRLSEKTGDVTLTLDKVPTARVQVFYVEEEADAQKALTLKLERAEKVEALKVWKSVVAAARLDVSNNNTGVATATSGEGNALNLRPADGIRTPVQRGNATHGHGAFIVGATEVDWDFGSASSVPRLEVIPGAELTFTVGQDFRRQDIGGITLVAQGKAESTFPVEGRDDGPTAADLTSAAWIHHRSAEPFLGQDVELGEGAIFGFHADAAASEADTQNEGVVLAGELRLTGNATLRADFESASGGAGAARLPHFVAAGGIRATKPGLTLIVDAPTHQSADGQGGTGDWHCHTATLTGKDFRLWKTGPGTVTFYATTPPSVTGKVTVEEGTLAVTAAADTPVGAKGLHVKKGATLADSGRMSGTARRLAIVPDGQTLSGGGTVEGPLGLRLGATYLAKQDEALTVEGGLTVGAAGEGSDATHVNVSLPADYVGDTPYLVSGVEETTVRRRLLPRKEAARWDAIAWLEGGRTTYAAREPAMPEPAAGDLEGNETVNAWHDGFEAILVNQYQSLGHAYVGATQGRTRAGTAHLSASEINEALYAFSGISAFAPSDGAATGGRTYIDAHNFFVAYEFGVSGMTFATIEGKEYAVVEVKVRNALAESFGEAVAAAAAEGAAAFRTKTKITFKAMKDGQALDLPEDVMVTEVANLAGDEGRSASGDTRYFALPYEALKKFFGEAPILLRPCAENDVELP